MALPPAVRLIRERAGTTVDPHDSVLTLRDGDTIALVSPTPTTAGARRRSAAARRSVDSEPVAAWWMCGAFGTTAALLFALVPDTLPHGWRWLVVLALVFAAVAAATVLISRRRSVASTTVGAAVLGPTALVAAAAVALTPPHAYGLPLTMVTVCAAGAAFLALCGVIARGAIARVQIATLGVVLTVVGLVHAVVVLLDVPESSAAAVLVGAVPMALRAVPASLLEVPTGMFIDIERHQQLRWTVRQNLPEAIPTVDRTRIADLVARSQARMLTATAAIVAVAVLFLPGALDSTALAPAIDRWGRLALVVFTVTALALTARHHSSRRLRMIVGGGAVATALIASVAMLPLLTRDSTVVLTIVTLAIAVVVPIGIIPVARGARSLWWSRFGDVIETLCVVLALPAGLVAAGTVDAIRGLMN